MWQTVTVNAMIPATFVGDGLMESTAEVGNVFRFGLFEANSTSNTLTRGGLRVKIQDQPFQLLMLLLVVKSKDENSFDFGEQFSIGICDQIDRAFINVLAAVVRELTLTVRPVSS